jgi:hypothetical protein
MSSYIEPFYKQLFLLCLAALADMQKGIGFCIKYEDCIHCNKNTVVLSVFF